MRGVDGSPDMMNLPRGPACLGRHEPVKKKLPPFYEFDQMVKEKYGISDDMYQKMTNEERNNKLKELLAKETIIIFPKEDEKSSDGMPNFAIIFTDLKEMAVEKDKKQAKKVTKAKTDVGAIKRNKN